jgi:hypothetical protein
VQRWHHGEGGERILNTAVFAAICIGLWLGPVIVIVAIKRIARLFDIDLRRQPPPDEPDYRRW